ncbi:transcription factor SOX-18-like [Dermacentor albipictus]|uniref:transcription factor SOX-18-like n=1 Tax=Dermacentor albipictus TaxID=60249 RepID=UPI0038FCE70F
MVGPPQGWHVDPGECEPSPSASLQQTTNGTRLRSVPRRRSLPAAEASTALPALAPDPGVEGASQSSEVHHSYQVQSCIPRRPNTFMLSAHGKRRSGAAENPNENNQLVSSRPSKLWRSLIVADKQHYQRDAAAAAAVHQMKHPGYVNNQREAQRCKGQERSSKLKSGTW